MTSAKVKTTSTATIQAQSLRILASRSFGEAVERVESKLDLSTRSQLGPVWTDDARLGAALMAGLQHLNDAENERNAAAAREVDAL